MKTTTICDGTGMRVKGVRPGAPIACWCCGIRLAADDECRVPEHAASADAVLSDDDRAARAAERRAYGMPGVR